MRRLFCCTQNRRFSFFGLNAADDGLFCVNIEALCHINSIKRSLFTSLDVYLPNDGGRAHMPLRYHDKA